MLVAEPNQSRGIWPSGRIVSTPAWIRWDGPSSHGAYSIREYKRLITKLCFLEEGKTYCRSRNCKST